VRFGPQVVVPISARTQLGPVVVDLAHGPLT
jgi:hypothetical protein